MDHQSSAPELLRQWREGADRSQTAIAGDLDVRPNTVCEWERGSRRPDLPNALRLEHLSNGSVPAVAWGYDAAEVARLLAAMVSVAQRAEGTADDPATAPTVPAPRPSTPPGSP